MYKVDFSYTETKYDTEEIEGVDLTEEDILRQLEALYPLAEEIEIVEFTEV